MLWAGPALWRRARPDERPRQGPVLGTGQRGPSEGRSAGCDPSAPSAQGRPHGAGGRSLSAWPVSERSTWTCRPAARTQASASVGPGMRCRGGTPTGPAHECRSPPFIDDLWSAWRNQRQCFSHCPGTSERASLPVPSACDSQGGCAAAAATAATLKVPERRLLSQWLDLAWMCSPLDSAPCLPELWLMGCGPVHHQAASPGRKLAAQECEIFNSELRFRATVLGVEMRGCVIGKEHPDCDSIESADFRRSRPKRPLYQRPPTRTSRFGEDTSRPGRGREPRPMKLHRMVRS